MNSQGFFFWDSGSSPGRFYLKLSALQTPLLQNHTAKSALHHAKTDKAEHVGLETNET